MKKRTLLYVEDDPANQKLIRLFLKSEPVDIVTAENVEEALELLQSHPPDVIVVDLNLQEEGDGAGLIHSIRSMAGYESVPIFVFSGYDRSQLKQYEIDHMIQKFFRKPTSKKSLIDAFRSLDDID